MTRFTRPFFKLLIPVCVSLLAACGTDTGPATAPVSTTGTAGAAETVIDSSDATVVDGDVDTATTEAPESAEVTGTLRITEWVADCSMGPPLTAEPADCEMFGGYMLVPVSIDLDRTGTLEGAESFFGTYAVADDNSFVFAGMSTFAGAVGECGEGVAVFNTAGTGAFDLGRSADLGSPVLGPVASVSYTATASTLSTISAALDVTNQVAASAEGEVSGTVRCGDDDASIEAVRPDAGVMTVDALDWTGPAAFAQGETCVPLSPVEEEACPVVDGLVVHRLSNRLTFSGAFDGAARFLAPNLLSADADFEHSAIMIFEGVVEGCGEGSVVFVNEAVGNAFEPEFPHQRAFTPSSFDPGSIGVFVDGGVTPTGLVSGEMAGSYSCDGA